MNEEWRPTHDPRYEVSNLGRVRSYIAVGGNLRDLTRCPRRLAPKILKPGLTSAGYPSVVFAGRKTQLVHRLVAAAFIGICPDGMEVRHKDDDRTNANADNLEYGTREDNVADMMTRLRGKYKLGPKGVRQAKRLLRQGLTQAEIAQRLGVCRMTINRLSTGASWRHLAA